MTPRAAASQYLRYKKQEVSAGKQMAFDAGRSGRGAIGLLIADQKARREIDRPAPQKIQYHSRRRLAPVADAPIFQTNRFRVERAVAYIVEMGSGCGKLGRKLRVEGRYVVLRIEPPRDPRLIGDKEYE